MSPQASRERYESAAFFSRCHGKAGIVLGPIGLGQIAVGRLDRGNTVEPQQGRQALLQGPEDPLDATAGFWAVGRDVLDAELGQGAPDLGRLLLINRAARLRGGEVMTAPVGIE